MRVFILCLILGCLALQGAAPADAAGPATNPASGDVLPPGQQPGTFHFAWHGDVKFSAQSMFPVAVTLSSAGRPVAKVDVADDKPFVIEADLRSGSHSLYSEPTSREAKEAYWGAYGPSFQIGADGRIRYITGQLIRHDLRMKLLEPAIFAKADALRPVLRWKAVPGAAEYQLSWFEELPADRTVVKTVQSIKAAGPQYEFEEDVVPKRLYGWDVHVIDAAGNELAHGNSYFLTPGVENEDLKAPGNPALPPAGSGWLGVAVRRQDPAIAELFQSKPGLVVEAVLPDSPAVAARLEVWDVIVKVADHPTTTVEDFIHSVAAQAPGTSVQLTVWRNSTEKTITAVLGKRPATPATKPATQPVDTRQD